MFTTAAVAALASCVQVAGLDDFRDAPPSGGGGAAQTATSASTVATGSGAAASSGGSGGGAGGSVGGAGGGNGPRCDDPAVRIAFVSASTYSLPMSAGLATLTDYCNEEAADDCGAKTFTAWVSTGGNNVIDRIASGPAAWYRPDGAQLATSIADLTDGTLMAPISAHADGSAGPASAAVWTGTDVDGTSSGDNCNNWVQSGTSATLGLTASSQADWTNHTTGPCTGARRVYCFEAP